MRTLLRSAPIRRDALSLDLPRPSRRLTLPVLAGLVAAGLALSACSSPSDMGGAADLGAAADLSSPPPPKDLSGPDLASARCELPPELKLIPMASTGAVTIGQLPASPEVRTAEVDATAGGSMASSKNPFVYLDLIAGKKVELSDVQAQDSGDWDVALKRWQLKVNSGDSGPSGVTVALVDGKDLSEVTAAPTTRFEADRYFDDKCVVQLDPIGGLLTQLSDWYDYESGTSRITPKKRVYVLKRRDGKGHIKLQITAYYKGMTSANYTLQWSMLP